MSDSPLTPLLVDGSGRDGTTLLMQLLGTSPEVAFDRIYPFEQRYYTYLLHWSRLPTREDWDEERWSLDSLAHVETLEGDDSIGPLPWPERSLIGGSEGTFWREAFDAAWAAFSKRAREAVRSRLGDGGLEVRYYAQKSADTWALPFEQLPGLRMICLLRDPRDTWLSSVAFHRRRLEQGDTFLPIDPGASEEEMLTVFLDHQQQRLGWLLTVEEERGAPLIRYESLVTDLVGEAGRIGAWLGVELDGEAVLRRRGEFSDHMTSGSPESSIGRWRSEMPPDLAARFWQAMGDELARLGYEAE
jgi:hypothetical protein